MRSTCPTYLMNLDYITLMIFGGSMHYEAPYYAVLFILLLLPLSYVQIFFSELCSQLTNDMWERFVTLNASLDI
jgi:hypothetical protein